MSFPLLYALLFLSVALALLLILVCQLSATIDAFRSGILHGILCLVVPLYSVGWLLFGSDHRLRLLLAAGQIISLLLLLAMAVLGCMVYAESSSVLPFIYTVI